MPEAKFILFVVDDDESVCASLKLLIESHGYCAVTFKSAEDFSRFELRGEPVFPHSRYPSAGDEWVFKLQEHLIKSQTRIPVIFITAHDRYRMVDEAMRLGAIAYLRKPFDEHCLLDPIQLGRGKRV